METTITVQIRRLSSQQRVRYANREPCLLRELDLHSIHYHGPTHSVLGSLVRSGDQVAWRRTQVYLILLKDSRIAPGVVSFRHDPSTTKCWHVGYWLHPSERGKGIMALGLQQAVADLLRFTNRPIKIFATVDLTNHASIATLGKLNFELEKKNETLGLASFALKLP